MKLENDPYFGFDDIEDRVLDRVCGVYRILFPNGFSYYGSSVNLKRRLLDHYKKLRQNRHANYKLQGMYRRYRKEGTRVQILKVCETKKEAREAEQLYIDFRGEQLNLDNQVYRN